MKTESLRIIRCEVIRALNDSNIDQADKVELLINLYHFLDEREYDNAIKLLQKGRKPKDEVRVRRN